MLLTYHEAASRLGVSPRTVRRLVAKKRLRAARYGWRTVRIRSADVADFETKGIRK